MGRHDIRTYDADDPGANKPLTRDEKEAEKEADRRARERRAAERREQQQNPESTDVKTAPA